jgi:thymidylate kinase
MPLIAFLGCDGAGKSAVIEGLAQILSEEGRVVCRGHWRPRPLQADACEEAIAAAADPHGRTPRGMLGSVAKLGWIWGNWWLAWMLGLRKRSRSAFVLYDRYHADMLIDARRYRYGGPLWLARLASSTMPQPDRVIYLDAPVEVLLSRKQEVEAEALELSRARYLSFCEGNGMARVVDASRPLAEVIDAVRTKIDE